MCSSGLAGRPSTSTLIHSFGLWERAQEQQGKWASVCVVGGGGWASNVRSSELDVHHRQFQPLFISKFMTPAKTFCDTC